MSILKLNTKRLILPFVAALLSVVASSISLALPQEVDRVGTNDVASGATYTQTGSIGTFDVYKTNTRVQFGGGGVNTANGELLDFNNKTVASGAVMLLEDVSGNMSEFYGDYSGDVNVFFINQNGILSGVGVESNLPNLVTTTYAVSVLNNSQYEFTADANSVGSIQIEGFSSSGSAAFLSNSIDVNGSLIAGGDISALAGGKVIVSKLGSMFQFDVTEALSTTSGEMLINVTDQGSVEGKNVTLHGWVTDPQSYAINNKGMIKAKGLSVATDGRIRLIAKGGKIQSTGQLSTEQGSGGGTITANAGIIELGGSVSADRMDTTIGEQTVLGVFDMLAGAKLELNGLSITGKGTINDIKGLANFKISGLNSGTAAYRGIGTDTWDNVAAVNFENIGRLFASSAVANNIIVEQGGQLLQSINGINVGEITGGALNDEFFINGSVEKINGSGGDDTFSIESKGRVLQHLNGGSDTDTVVNVLSPVRVDSFGVPNSSGLSGFSDGVNGWSNIQNVVPRSIAIPFSPANIIAWSPVFGNVSSLGSVSLGLVGTGDELRMPCGSGGNIVGASANIDKPDCFTKYNSPEYQQLISSLIHFDNNSYALTAASVARLNKISDFVVESQLFDQVVLAGHTDSNASHAYNMRLANKRVNAASDYMQERGVDAGLLKAYAFGETLPVKLNDSDEGRAYNRRVHIELKK